MIGADCQVAIIIVLKAPTFLVGNNAVNKLLNLEYIYIITAPLIAASPQILVTGAFAVWWLDNFYYQEWRIFFLGFIGYYSLVVVAVWVCCAVVCIDRKSVV